MITQEQQKQSAELIQTLAQKAWESSNFKEQLINNPVATIESVTGQKMQTNLNVVVEDQSNDSIIYLNIPRKVDMDTLELSDEQLEMVSGGTDISFVVGYGLIALGMIGMSYAFGYSVGKDRAEAVAASKTKP
jgi:hypothetical protein